MRTEQLRRSRWPRAALFALPLGLALITLSGCPGKLSDKQSFEDYAAAHADDDVAGAPPQSEGTAGTSSSPNGACGDVEARIFIPTCGGTGCHNATAPQQDLDLVSPGVAARVVGVAAKACLQVLADPAHPEDSLMYKKLLIKPACGGQMPLARPPLSSTDTACVLAWIAAQTAP